MLRDKSYEDFQPMNEVFTEIDVLYIISILHYMISVSDTKI